MGTEADGGAGADAAAGTEPLVWESFFWGLLSAVSLNIGSVIGVTCLPRQRVRAVLMSFGGGALLFALSIELFGGVLHHSEAENSTAAVWVMEGSAVVGGLFFAVLNHALNVLGADLRKHSTRKSRFARLRALLLRRLAHRLYKIPFFSVLTLEELGDLIQSAMYKERFGAGDIIMSSETHDSGIFFILSGMVRLQIYGKDQPDSPTPTVSSPQEVRVAGSPPTSPGLPKAFRRNDSTEHLAEKRPLNSWDLGTNQIFGDMTVLCGSYLQAQATALEVTKVLVLPGHEVARLIEENAAVRDQISLRAVERLRQVAELRHLPDHALASLSAQCALVRYQPGDVVFHGAVNAATPVICLVLGSIEFKCNESKDRSSRRTLHASRLLCTEHLKSGKVSKPLCMVAAEPSTVLVINRSDINSAMAQVPQQTPGVSMKMESKMAPAPLPGQVVSPDPLPGQVDVPDTTPPVCQRVRGGSVVSPVAGVQEADNTVIYDVEEATSQQTTSVPEMILKRSETRSSSEISKDIDTPRKRPVFQRGLSINLGKGSLNSLNSLGHDLGWDKPLKEGHEEQLHGLTRMGSMTMGQVTDLELEEHQLDFAAQAPPRSSSKTSEHSKASLRVSRCSGKELPPSTEVEPAAGLTVQHEAEPPDVEAPTIAEGDDGGVVGHRNSRNSKTSHTGAAANSARTGDGGGTAQAHDKTRHRAVMVWLGILIDAVPESLVIGILVNKTVGEDGVEAENRSSRAAAAALPFVIGVFLSNLPESMSSSGSMKLHGMRVSTILMMWLTTTVLTAVGASLGAVLFPPNSSGDASAEIAVVAVEGLAAGAMLTMIAQTMMPEAFEQGGDIVGLSCLAGFLCALSVKLIPIAES